MDVGNLMTVRKIDLHDMTWRQAREAFIGVFNEAARDRSGTTPTWIEVIHGYGSTGEGGVIRDRLRRYLNQHEPFFEFHHRREPGRQRRPHVRYSGEASPRW